MVSELTTWLRGYKRFSILNAAEHGILNAHKYKNIMKSALAGSNKPRMLCFLFINVKMPTILGILTFLSRKNFMLNSVEHEKMFWNFSICIFDSGDDFTFKYYRFLNCDTKVLNFTCVIN